MNELDNWLDSIAADPDDWVRRAVFADWLEEQGDGRAAAVRASRDAVGCLLEFPARSEVVSPAHPHHHLHLKGVIQAGEVLRPVLRLSGFGRWQIANLMLRPADIVRVQAVVTHKEGGDHCTALNWLGMGPVGLTGTKVFPATNFTLSLAAHPPSQVEWSMGAVVWG